MIILSERTIVKREHPRNYKKVDEPLFIHEFEKVIPEVSLKCFQNLFLSSEGYIFRPFQVISRRNSISFKSVISIFLFRKYKKRPSNKSYLILFDKWTHNYFHWVTEFMTCLACLEKKKNLDEFIILLPREYKNDPVKTAFLNLFPYLNIEYIADNELFILKKAYVYSVLPFSGNYAPEAIYTLVSKFSMLKIDVSKSFSKVYISRKYALKRKIENENNLIEYLKNNGFEIVYAEHCTLLDIASILSQCNILISNHGAGLTNMIFMKKESSVVEIRKIDDKKNNCYFNLTNCLNLNYYYFFLDSRNIFDFHNDKFLNIIND